MFSNLRQLMSFEFSHLMSQPAIDASQNTSNSGTSSDLNKQKKVELFGYRRPTFLQLLTSDEVIASASHNVRPIIVPRDLSLLPWGTGYAECVNAGKSRFNEDQGAFHRHVLSDPTQGHPDLPYSYFGIFDGHAGFGAAVAASQQLHHILHKKLVDCLDILLPRDPNDIKVPTLNSQKGFMLPFVPKMSNDEFCKRVCKDDVIIGALESAFIEMDDLIEENAKDDFEIHGGCTACVALFINGKVYVANAGDSRAVLCQRRSPATTQVATKKASTENDTHDHYMSFNEATNLVDGGEVYATPLSFDHTPETERQRLMGVAQHLNSKGGKYNANNYVVRPQSEDLGLRVLCRQGTMRGWTYKTVTQSDVTVPVVIGSGKRSRLLATLGVTRGFGDHHLYSNLRRERIKPFLTPQPEVNYRDLTKIVSIPDEHNEDGDYGILVLGTDGLWDVSENDAVARTVFNTLSYEKEKYRYTMIAQQLVAKARGTKYMSRWRLNHSDAAATVDDISVFVIPIYQYYKEHVAWEQKCLRECAAKTTPEAAVEEKPIAEATQNIEGIHLAYAQNGVANGVDLAATDLVEEKKLDNSATEVGVNTSNSNVKVQEGQEVKLTGAKVQAEEHKLEQTIEAKLQQNDSKEFMHGWI